MPKYSSEAERLWPYLIGRVQRVVSSAAGGTSGSTGVGGAPSPHALNSVHHTGTLADSQAPQFLLVDGSRTLTGNLAVNSGITIDGVDLSAHAADPDAHHSEDHVLATNAGLGGTHSMSGATAGYVLRASSATAAAFAQLQHTDLGSVTANQHHNQIHNIVGSDHTITGSLYQLVGATGSNTLGLLTPSVDVGTTPAAAILRSTSAGGLILGTLTVKGNVDITTGGDLTVGANVLFVDVSQESIGILRAPDAQFALDVNGPIRGTEIVGKHAIQLEDLALLLHFDGGFPYESNYTGERNAIPMGRAPTNTNTYFHFRPGKFYKAAVFGDTATNLCKNPSFETNTTFWSISNDAGGDLGVTRVTDEFWYGAACAKLTWTTINNSQFFTSPVVSAAAAKYSAGVWLRAAVPCSVELRIMRDASPYTTLATSTVAVTEDWQWFSLTTSAAATAADPLRFDLFPQGSANTVWVDGVMFEQSNYCSWYFDGSVGDGNRNASGTSGYAWTGTAHASTSTRTAARANYDLDSMVAHRWSFMAYLRFANGTPYNATPALELTLDTGSYVRIYQGSGALYAWINNGASTFKSFALASFDTNAWYHIAVTWDGTTLTGYLDGAAVWTFAAGFTGLPAQVWLGAYSGPTHGSVMIDDMVVSRQCLSAERVRAIYESDAPVFAESSVFHFRATPKGLVWADEEGLWMRDADGDPVLGVYGGAAASKSWGGITLESGDFLLGRSPSGYIHWDDSTDTLQVRGSIIIDNPEDIAYADLSGLPTALSDINSSEGTKLGGIAAGATVGAAWGTNLTGRPTELTDGRVAAGLNSSGHLVTKVLPGSNVGTPGGAGLFLGADKMGYFNGAAWKTYMDNSGQFFFSGSTGARLAWDGTDLYGTDGSTVQWYARASTGKLYAGGGNVFLDKDGVTLLPTTVTSLEPIPYVSSVKWINGGLYDVAALVGQYDSASIVNRLVLSGIADGASAEAVLQTTDNDGDNSFYSRVTCRSDGYVHVEGSALDVASAELYFDGAVMQELTFASAVPIAHGAGGVRRYGFNTGALASGNVVTITITGNLAKAAYVVNVTGASATTATNSRYCMVANRIMWRMPNTLGSSASISLADDLGTYTADVVWSGFAAITDGIRATLTCTGGGLNMGNHWLIEVVGYNDFDISVTVT